MSIETIPAPAAPVATGTYSINTYADANYTTTAGTVTGNNKTLALRIYWPNVSDPTIPLPLVVYCPTLGYAVSVANNADTTMQTYFVSAGCICVNMQTRVMGDDPLSTGDTVSMNSVSRAIHAAPLDINTGLRYVMKTYAAHANGVIEPSQIFLAGTSAGAISAMAYTMIYPSHPIAGVINWSGAFGIEDLSGTSYTSYLRGQWNYRETYYKTSTCAFLGGADTIIGTAYIDSLRTKLALMPSNITHYDADGGHAGPDTFDATALTGATTVAQAVSNYLIARCRTITPTATLRKNAATWRKNWYRQESRYR